MAANFLLFAVKLYSGLATSSLCIYSDAINNLFDTLSCALAFAGLLLAKKAATADYPDGFGKAEDLAGFIMSVTVGLTGVYFAYMSLERFMYPRPVNFLLRHALFLGGTIIVKLILGISFLRLSKKRESVVLKTVCMDSFADCGVTAMTLLSFILSEYSGLRADAVFGLVISVIIIINAVKLLKLSTEKLLGRNSAVINGEITEILLTCGFETADVKTYAAGTALTAAADVSGGGDETKARILTKENTGADLFIKRR